ncbi:AEC family transporter [Mycoplasma sp. 4044]
MKDFVNVISQQGMWGGVLATCAFVAIGFIVTKMGLFTKEVNQKISKFTLQWALPFLCIVAFMQPATANLGKEIGTIIGISAAFYILAAIVSKLVVKCGPRMVPGLVKRKALVLYEKQNGSQEASEHEKAAAIASIEAKLLTVMMMVSYGSLQFFAYPMVIAMTGSIFDSSALALAQVWCIPYMIGAFSYVLIQYSGQKVSAKNIKPILKAVFSPMMCCLYFSLFMWAIQFAVKTEFTSVGKTPFTPYDPISEQIKALSAGSNVSTGAIYYNSIIAAPKANLENIYNVTLGSLSESQVSLLKAELLQNYLKTPRTEAELLAFKEALKTNIIAGGTLGNADVIQGVLQIVKTKDISSLPITIKLGENITADNLNWIQTVARSSLGKKVQFWASFKTNLPALGKILDAGTAIISPLAWLVIGGTLATSNLKAAAKNPTVWIATSLKLILMPLIMLVIALPLVHAGVLSPSTGTLLVLFGATPPAAVCIIFAVSAKHPEVALTAEVSALSTLLCLIAMPVWVIIASVATNAVKPVATLGV